MINMIIIYVIGLILVLFTTVIWNKNFKEAIKIYLTVFVIFTILITVVVYNYSNIH